MPTWVINLLISVGVGMVATTLFAKLLPKAKLVKWIEKPCRAAGMAISKFLILRLGKGTAEKVEEGIIVTLLEVAEMAPRFVKEGLIADNNKKKEGKK